MRFTKYIILAFLAIVATLRVSAQTENQIIVNDVQMTANSEKVLTVNMNNKDDIVAVELSLRVPNGFSIDPDFITLSDRAQNHQVTARKIDGNRYSIVIVSPDNKPFNGTSGTLLSMTLKAGAVSDGEYSLTLLDAIMAISSGKNVIDSATDGTVTIGESRSPDYVVQSIQTTDSNVMPNDLLHLSWQVKNEGNIDGTVGWSEYVYLLSDNGDTICISKKYSNATILVPGAYISRNAVIELPKEVGIDGKVDIAITIVPDLGSGEIEEYQANNTTRTQNAPLQVGKCLYLSIPSYEFVEGEIQSVFCKLSRSGSWSSDEEFKLELQPEDSRLSIPKSITIHRREAAAFFYLTINNNDIRDACSGFKVRVEGNEYEPIEEALTIYDDEMPIIHVNASVSEVTEGETFQLIITANSPAEEPMKLKITSEKSWRFNFPATVEIPVGETEVTVDVKAVDNNEIDMAEGVAFRITTPWHAESECIVILNDNDMPTLSFTLAPESVGEDGGPAALLGVIKRVDKFDKRITLKLKDDSNGLLKYTSETIVLEKGKSEVQFNIGVVDNDSVDGDKTVHVEAAVYSTSCKCSVAGNGEGLLSSTVTIIDNDGPALKIKPATTTILEGSSNNVFTISHNLPPTQEVRVTVTSDKDDMLEYDHELVIPAGSSAIDLLVNVKNNDISDDSNVVTFKVQAEGYAIGSCWLVITDQTLPDATVSIRADKQFAKAEENVGLTIVVRNIGNTPLRSSVPVQFAFSGKKGKTKLTTDRPLLPGDSIEIEYNYLLPAVVGDYYFEATVNADNIIPEMLFVNNVSEKAQIILLPRFTATATADKKRYEQGESIVISGEALGEEGKNAKVEVYLINDYTRIALETKTDETGHYSIIWKPLGKMLGHFDIGACYPGTNLKETMDAIDVFGLSSTGSSEFCEVTLGETYTGKIVVYNPCPIYQTNLKVMQKAQSDNCAFTFSTPSIVKAGESVEITYIIKNDGPSTGDSWQEMPIEITTAEGAKLDFLLHYYVYVQKAILLPSTEHISTTMKLDSPREYPVTIYNVGQEKTGRITLSLPSWIETATPREMASLGHGDSTTIILRFMPTAQMELNGKITGQLGVNCENGDGTIIGFDITPVSDSKGTLKIDVVDEFTFYTDEAPHVANAKIQVLNPATNEIVAQGETVQDGTFTAELEEGYYSITVEADRHHTYKSQMMVDPGTVKAEEVFLPYDAVTYDYNVVETEVIDEYVIETVVKYETRVPKPVLTMTLPKDKPLPNSVFQVIVKNLGLINAVDVNLSLAVPKDYTVEYLNATSLDTLAPQSSYILYAMLKPVSHDVRPAQRRAISEEEYCMAMRGIGSFRNLCKKYSNEEIFKAYIKWGDCKVEDLTDVKDPDEKPEKKNPRRPREDKGKFKYIISYPPDEEFVINMLCREPQSDVGGTNPYPDYFPFDPEKDPSWDKCKKVMLQEGGSCALSVLSNFIPGNRCWVALGTYAFSSAINGIGEPSFSDVTGLFTSAAECIGSLIPGFGLAQGIALSGAECLSSALDIIRGCQSEAETKGVNGAQRAYGSGQDDPFYDFFRKFAVIKESLDAFLDITTEIYGDESWLNAKPEELVRLNNYLTSFSPETRIDIDGNLLSLKPNDVSTESFYYFIERYNNTIVGHDSDYQGMSNYVHMDAILDLAKIIYNGESFAVEEGYTSTEEMMQEACEAFKGYLESIKKDEDTDDSNSICSTVTLSFKQKNMMARQAFRGTLTVNNGNKDEELRDVKLNLEVRDSEGKLATNREFQIDAESLDGFEGNLVLDAGWTLAADSKGTATILFLPTKYAAPTEPVGYTFGGSFSYVDSSTGLTVTRQLNPVTLTVNPSPNLEMTYFMQRDVYGDDPMTEEVESSVPAEFALLINNKGYGDAKNMNLTMNQPQIIENQKGLAVNFEIISSQVNGGEQSLALSNSMTSDFGDIPAQSQSYVQWWLNSSLLGHFIDYDVKATHLTSRDNPNLSLIDTVTIHELIHGFTVRTDTEVPVRGFLVNDITDIEDCPDEIYFTDATHQGVSKVRKASFTQSTDTEYVLNVTPSATGWNYGVLPDPTQGKQKIVSITRQSDNAVIPVDNIWQTPCTLKDGKNAVHENRIHFVFQMLDEEETFTLEFEPLPDVELKVIRFDGGPEEDEVIDEPLKQLSLAFNKPIEEGSFTTDDITLTCQGIRQDASQIEISSLNGSEYNLLLESLTNQSGYYVLTIHTSGIKDAEGFSGVESRQYAWEQALVGLGIEGTAGSHELMFKVSPIPIKEKMRISGNFREIRKLTIYDTRGLRMLEERNVSPNESIDVSMLRPGEYILTIQTDNGVGRIKIVKT